MKILIVEDEPKTGAYLKQGLTEAGFITDLAREGWNRATSDEYRFIPAPGQEAYAIISSEKGRLRKRMAPSAWG